MKPFWAHVDDDRGLVLLRGDVADLLDQAGVRHRARWSTSMHGWVVTGGDFADLAAAAENAGRSYRIKQVAS
jgi:hypothetical protein